MLRMSQNQVNKAVAKWEQAVIDASYPYIPADPYDEEADEPSCECCN